MSAVLAYFLDPNEDHGLNTQFLLEFVSAVENKTAKIDNMSLDKSVISLEEPLNIKKAGKKGDSVVYVDVHLVLRDDSEKDVHYFLIENKIQSGAIKKGQLKDIYEAKRTEEGRDSSTSITVIFITPEHDSVKFKTEYENLSVKSKDNKCWIHWQSDENNNDSIQQIIRGIIEGEAIGELPPINEYVKHTFKAFVTHLSDIGKHRHTRNTKSPQLIGNSAGEESMFVSDYEIIRNKRRQFWVRKDGDKVVAKSALRQINTTLKLGVSESKNNKKSNTYQFAQDIWNKLADKDQVEN